MSPPTALPPTVPLADGWRVKGVLGDAWRDVPKHERRVSVEAWNTHPVAA